MPSVEYKNVYKKFKDGTNALRDFSLKINDGELVVLVGPSGCGKSTALRLLAGLEEVTRGEILIDGKQVNRIGPQQRNIAMVFQNYALYPHMDVRGNLEFPLKMRRTPKKQIAETVASIAEILDLKNLLDRKPGQLSGGQKQRVAMGRALVRNPSVFLLDEPLSNLDAKLRAQIRADIADLQKRLQKTTLYVTHDQVEAMTLGDRVAVMNNGELHQIGTPEELYKSPESIFVARFIGSPGMNIIPARPSEGGGKQLRVTSGTVAIPLARFAVSLPPEEKRIYIGIRPEAIRRVQQENDFCLQADIVTTEFLGPETLVHFHLQGTESGGPYVARIPGQFDYRERSTEFFFSGDDFMLFDEKGRALR